ncbi:MAG: PEGA domain-containing protein [Deltaproteobacteria bacterium]|nr:PEGA domain-containing protein [Deltaproteobacteria bacterium]
MTTETPLIDTLCPNCNGAVEVEDTDHLTCGYCGHHLRNPYRDETRRNDAETESRSPLTGMLPVVVEVLSFLLVAGIGLAVYLAHRSKADSQQSTPVAPEAEMRQRMLELETRRVEVEMREMEAQRQALAAELDAATAAVTDAVEDTQSRKNSEGDTALPKSPKEKRCGKTSGQSQPAKEDTAAPSPPATAGSQPGFLTVNSIPSSEVLVDGIPRGKTPLLRIQAVPGAHSVILVHPQLGRKIKTVTVESGKTEVVTVRF